MKWALKTDIWYSSHLCAFSLFVSQILVAKCLFRFHFRRFALHLSTDAYSGTSRQLLGSNSFLFTSRQETLQINLNPRLQSQKTSWDTAVFYGHLWDASVEVGIPQEAQAGLLIMCETKKNAFKILLMVFSSLWRVEIDYYLAIFCKKQMLDLFVDRELELFEVLCAVYLVLSHKNVIVVTLNLFQ